MTIIFIRTIIIFASIIFLLRLLGKRQLRELELSELVVSVMLADLAATPLQDIGIPLLNGLIPIVTLFACELVISGGILSSVRFRRIMCGKPEFLIIDGQILEKEMRKARFSVDELFEELRNKDILDIKKVKYAVLETDGSLSVFLFPEYQPVTPRDMKIKAKPEEYPIILIEDGVLLENNLKYVRRDRSWLDQQLDLRGCASPEDVFAMIYYSEKDIYFEKRGVG